jgi:hypothetical protein
MEEHSQNLQRRNICQRNGNDSSQAVIVETPILERKMNKVE